jgi:SynChlorMet cassette radical SAM/SPASM protein ScmE
MLYVNDSNCEIYYAANPDVSTRLIGDEEAVLYEPDTGQEKFINPSGRFVWQQLDGSVSTGEIARTICENFASAAFDRVLEDAAQFLDGLYAQGFVSRQPDRLSPAGVQREFPHIDDAPQTLDISVTGRCNLACRYCFYADAMHSRPDLPAEQWLSFFDELGRLAVRKVCLSGGEIFVRSDLMDLIDGLIANRMRYSLLTNGTLVTEKTVSLLEKRRPKARLESIQVSIDGSCPEVHDASRGKGSFRKAIQGLRLLHEAGLPVTSRVTINRHNVDDLEHIAGLLLDEIGLPGFSTNDAMPVGAGCSNQDTITLQPRQQLKAMKAMARLEKRYSGRITGAAGPLANRRIYQEMENARANGAKATNRQMGYLSACGCVFNKLAVHHDGVVTPCNMLPEMELGKINVDSLKKIWTSHPTLKALKARRQIPMSKVPGCEACEWAPYCNGSCPGLAYEMTGDFNHANPHDCYKRFLENFDSEELNLLRY